MVPLIKNQEQLMAIPQTPNQTSLPRNKPSKIKANSFYNSTFAITWDIGLVMVGLAVAGIFDIHFLGLNLSFMHCFVLASSGLLAVWSGVTSRQRAFVINSILGVFFLINAIVGFLVGDRGHFQIGYGTSADLMVKFAPGFLELSTIDHIFHLGLAIFFLLEAYSWKRQSLDFPANLRRQHRKR